ncbi:MAG: hypothetical protein HW412_2098 [Bacteroidetes bacterium]|nr:hypothetical protein [Bacteroidota bacterium]
MVSEAEPRNLLCVHLSPFDGVYPAVSFDSAQDDGGAQGDCCVFEAVKVRHYPYSGCISQKRFGY